MAGGGVEGEFKGGGAGVDGEDEVVVLLGRC